MAAEPAEVQGSRTRTRTGHPEKFRLLLDRFPHPDRADDPDPARRRWRSSEIEAGSKALGEKVSAAYLSGVLHDNIKTVGMDKAHVISRVIGFPFELWLTEPDTWEERLRRASLARFAPDIVQVTARRLQTLFDAHANPETNLPYTTEEVARKSNGRLATEEVEAILHGTLSDPTMSQLAALSDVFGIDFSYWSPHREDEPVISREALDALQNSKRYEILIKSDLSEAHLDFLLAMVDQLHVLEKRKEDG